MTDAPSRSHSDRRPSGEGAPARPRPFDRGPRPLLRGIIHSRAVWAFIGSGTALIVVAAVQHGTGAPTWLSALYVACLVGAMAVSALYHRGRWRSGEVVRRWRRADHSMIAVFIAGTYGPVVVVALEPRTALFILSVCWVLAFGVVVLNMWWIGHPRWIDVVVYLALGWLIIWEAPALWQGAGAAGTILLVVGGVVYSLGALVYGLRWPNPSERWFGFHEVFHAATIIAAIVHHVAIWLIVALPR